MPSSHRALTVATPCWPGRQAPDRLQRLLNAAARVVSRPNTGKFDRGLTRLLHSELHWLDVPQRIRHKLGVISSPVSPRQCSPVPHELLPPHVGCCQSSATSIFQPPLSSYHDIVAASTLGRRAFSVAGPMAWNAMPDDLRDPSLSADILRKRLNLLKTHLFRNALGHVAH